jgi:hypothetical protein
MKVLALLFAASLASAAAPPRLRGPIDAAGVHLARRVSRDGGASWSVRENLTALPGAGWGGLLVLLDRTGELQVVVTRLRGEGKAIAIDRFIDLWRLRTTGGQRAWTAPQRIFEGYVGSIQQMVQLRTGRILLPFAMWIGGRAAGPPTGPNETTAVYSDDGGATWRMSPARLTAPSRRSTTARTTARWSPRCWSGATAASGC